MRRAASLLLIALVASTAYAATPEEFESVVDFSMTLESLYERVNSEGAELLQDGRYLILQGTVASAMVIDPGPESYQALLELVSGEWRGLEEIQVFKAYVVLVGPDFASRVPQRLPREPGPEVIVANSKVMIVGQFVDVAQDEFGDVVPVIQAVYIR